MKWLIGTVAGVLAGLALFQVTAKADVQTVQTSAGAVQVQKMVGGLDEPWALAFLPEGFLITERSGRLLIIQGGEAQPVRGVPEVWDNGQGGLLDVVAAREFAASREIFLTYSKPVGRGAATAVVAAQLSSDNDRLQNLREIFVMNAPTRRGQHFGSRIVEAPDGTLFVTLGDRGDAPNSQDLQMHNGKVIRINRDGSAPSDNPFVNVGGLPEVWSYGHRNPQGAALDADGTLWIVEHGAQGGDEINRPGPGRNYGWPVISYGRNYNGSKIGEGTAKPGMEQPLHYWDPSIAPSGMMIYSGKLFPEWRGDIFVGSLKFDMISRLEHGNGVTEAERLFQDRFIRIRDIREAPDGTIWFLSVGDGAAYRITPG
ncbi:PQQ-dependent sugar dehydrogenase [Halovulum sp. GXIMD14793]